MRREVEIRYPIGPAPSALGIGTATVNVGYLLRHVTRAHDPNAAAFGATAVIRAYARWGLYRYLPLVHSPPAFRVRDVPLDPRKRGIVSEDLGLALALFALDRLRALPVFTKWELSLPANHAHLARRLARRGLSYRRALAAVRALSRTLRGADFLGYDHARKAWVVCEAKGSFGPMPTDGHAARAAALGTGTTPRATLPALARGIRQAHETAMEIRKVGPTNKILSYATLHTGRVAAASTVTIIDPPEDDEALKILRQHSHMIREQAAEAHYAWVAGFLGLPENLWGSAQVGQLRSDRPFLVRFTVPDGDGRELPVEAWLDFSVAEAVAAGSLTNLERAIAELPTGAPGDGFYCEVQAEK